MPRQTIINVRPADGFLCEGVASPLCSCRPVITNTVRDGRVAVVTVAHRVTR